MNYEIIVKGLVQGIGFRPYIYRLANSMELDGDVRNSGGAVCIRLKGIDEDKAYEFTEHIKAQQPKEARIDSVLIKPVEGNTDSAGFFIIDSDERRNDELPDIPVDIAICSRCISEMKDMNDRRYGYPYISCTTCGPRYTIIKKLPYDRVNTTMNVFDMCPDCEEEYHDGKDPMARRHYAQTISCNDCGPRPILDEAGKISEGNYALSNAFRIIENGGILALKAVGGYQFVCSVEDTYAILKLREIKGREKRPFAVMFANADEVREYALMDKEEEKLLKSYRRPIVLLKSGGRKRLNRFICGDSRYIGAMLPQSGVHEMIANACGPVIVTSANISGEPLIYTDEEFVRHEFDGIEGMLYYKRDIMVPLDDSVTRVFRGKTQVIRYARGYVPDKLEIDRSFDKSLLAMGGDLKSSFAIAKGRSIVLSGYFGDLASYRAKENLKAEIARFQELYAMRFKAIACDKHPGYVSGRLAREFADKNKIPLIGIYHHHAHIASVMAEHGLTHTIGVALDGTGYGRDGKIWGGEILYVSGSNAERKSHIDYYTLIGGDEAALDAGKDLLCLKHEAGFETGNPLIDTAMDEHINTFETSSAGRLFDIVSAALGFRTYNTYESECAIALENAALEALRLSLTTYAIPVTKDPRELLYYLIKAKEKGVGERELALGFHRMLSMWVIKECMEIRDEKADNNVCLSGGCFANRVLSNMCCDGLAEKGFHVYMNQRIPGNDQGIAVGQAYILALQ